MRRVVKHFSLMALLCLTSIACDLEDTTEPGEIGDAPPIPDDRQPACDDIQLSDDELALYDALMQARVNEELPRIPLSASMTLVAQVHADDAHINPDIFGSGGENACNLHSWSTSADWSGCCYTGDHAQAQCMWDKPKEIANFSGRGYEIAFRGHGTPQRMVDAWLSSPGHRNVLLNRDMWADFPFESIGVGISSDDQSGSRFAFVWFAEEPDCQ